MTIQAAVTAIQGVVENVTGIQAAPDNPPDAMLAFPFSVTYPGTGTWITESAGQKKGLHNLVCEIHVQDIGGLGVAYQASVGYGDTVPNALMSDPTLGGAVDTIVGEIRYTYGYLRWGSTEDQHLGWRFEITVKDRGAIS